MSDESQKRGSLLELGKLFLKLGVIGYGGPAAHIAMMEEEVVRKRKWMDHQEFLDLMGATNLIPGPNSTEMTMHCGRQRAGTAGLFVAGGLFILPAVLATLALAWFYVEYGEVPGVAPIFMGIRPAVVAIIVGAIIKLGKKSVKGIGLGILGLIGVAAGLMTVPEVLVILAAGVVWLILNQVKNKKLNSLIPLVVLSENLNQKADLMTLFLTFLKVGSILFGSGYVLVAYLQGELVDSLGWLTESELMDAIAMGQFTPGPVLSTATFVGYQILGFKGAAFATIGIFLPSFLFVLISAPLIERLQRSTAARSFLDGVNVGAVAIMISTTVFLVKQSVTDWKMALILVICMGLHQRGPKLSSMYIVAIGAFLGYISSFI